MALRPRPHLPSRLGRVQGPRCFQALQRGGHGALLSPRGSVGFREACSGLQVPLHPHHGAGLDLQPLGPEGQGLGPLPSSLPQSGPQGKPLQMPGSWGTPGFREHGVKLGGSRGLLVWGKGGQKRPRKAGPVRGKGAREGRCERGKAGQLVLGVLQVAAGTELARSWGSTKSSGKREKERVGGSQSPSVGCLSPSLFSDASSFTFNLPFLQSYSKCHLLREALQDCQSWAESLGCPRPLLLHPQRPVLR